MLFNTFLGAKLRKFLSQIIVIFTCIIVAIILIQEKQNSSLNNSKESEIIFDKETFNERLVSKRKKQSAPSITFKVQKGDTIEKILKKNNFLNTEIIEAIKETKKVYNPKNIIAGQKILVKYQIINQQKKIESIYIPLEFGKNFLLEKSNEEFIAKIIYEETINKITKKSGVITDSLYLSALRSKVDIKTITEVIRIFSFSVDFQRDIWPKDTFEILYEEEILKYDKTKKNSKNVLYANLVLNGDSLKLYRFETKDNNVEYFDEKGKSAQKLLMKTPIDGARLSSGYGKRRHPILGYDVKHRGVDFAAPTGTPIYAAGNGVIEMKQRNGAYGKYIRIRHINGFKTAYAHLSKYAKIKGGKVKQGQIIGYVGSTGRSTGPHLHYEIIKNGKRINPQTLKLPSGKKLKKEELQAFLEKKNKIDRRLDSLDVY